MKTKIVPIPKFVFREFNNKYVHRFWSGQEQFKQAKDEVNWIIKSLGLKRGIYVPHTRISNKINGGANETTNG